MKRRVFTSLCAASVLSVAAVLAGCSKNNAPASAASGAGSASAAASREARDHLVVGITPTLPPMEFRDVRTGVLSGYEIDMANELFKRANLKFEYRAIDWGKKDDELLKDKTIDVIWASMTITDERKALYGVSVPYIKNEQIAVVNPDSPIRSKDDLGGKKVVSHKGSIALDLLKQFKNSNGVGVQVEEYADLPEALSAVVAGKADAAVADSVSVNYYVERSPGKFRVLDQNFNEEEFGVAVRPNETALLEKINKELTAMQADGTSQAIYKRWFGEDK